MDAGSGRIVAATLTDRGVDDASQLVLDQISEPVASLTGGGAYDRTRVYAAVHERHPGAAIVVPPRSDAVLSDTARTAPTQRDRHIQMIAETGRMAWQRASDYNKRAGGESQMARWKGILGKALRFHSGPAQATEVAIGVMALNRTLELGRPNSVRLA